jgi:hypothetical protein
LDSALQLWTKDVRGVWRRAGALGEAAATAWGLVGGLDCCNRTGMVE